MRSKSIETEVQLRLDNGDNVWVIGDVHGHFATFKKLIENVELSGNDCIVMLEVLLQLLSCAVFVKQRTCTASEGIMNK